MKMTFGVLFGVLMLSAAAAARPTAQPLPAPPGGEPAQGSTERRPASPTQPADAPAQGSLPTQSAPPPIQSAQGEPVEPDPDHISTHVLEYRLTPSGELVWTSPRDGRIHPLTPPEDGDAAREARYQRAVERFLAAAGSRGAVQVRTIASYVRTKAAGEFDPDRLVRQAITPDIAAWVPDHPDEFRITPQGSLMWTMPSRGLMVYLQPVTMPENTPEEEVRLYRGALEAYRRAAPARFEVEAYAALVFAGRINPYEPGAETPPDSSGGAAAQPLSLPSPAPTAAVTLPPGAAERFANCLSCKGTGYVDIPADSPFNRTGHAVRETCALCGGTGKSKKP